MDHYAVLGNPISHSLSPLIHHLFAKQTAQKINYTSLLVPLTGLAQALDDFQSQGGCGVNITLPFKQQAFSLVDSVSLRAEQAGAINFIRFEPSGKRFGDNTDGMGLVIDIVNNQNITIKNKRVLLLGAGGAVCGVMGAILAAEPAELIIANRTEQKALALVNRFIHQVPIAACGLAALAGESFDLVINGTSASLQAESLSLPDGLLREQACCYDMVYGKKMTPFLQWAKDNQATCVVDGLGMLVEQAAESFYRWRQVRPETQQILTILK